MKKLCLHAFLACMIWIAGLPCALAETVYVSSITQITLRTEPGVEHRIVEMLKSGTSLEMVEYRKDWSMVKTDGGKEGWILTRFITREKPKILLVDELEQKNDKLTRELAELKTKHRELTRENARLADIEKSYNQLKNDSAQFFTLKKQYAQIQKDYQSQSSQIQVLEAGLKNDKTIFMLTGLGVFFLGLIFGVGARKKKKSSLL
ncbi:MAG: TIGR04211 family SH3 domain-containing protein [Desulfobacteraceae bacterium]|nr:MAG: TIGR04211 family SH3 domain-containing protein [Desulfobacteraceae bacterium]